jgi:multiple sugar transport system permease protein
MTMNEIFAIPPTVFTLSPQWNNYREVFTLISFGRYYSNTIFIALLNIIGTVLSNVCIAFAIARINFKGRKLMFSLSIGTLMLPYAVTMIPTFIEWKWLRGLNTFLPLIVPSFFGNAFFIFMLVQFFRTIPREYDEAAFVDGATYPQIISKIIVPMSKPALIVVVIFTFLNVWNDFMGPLLYLNDQNLYTLALGLRSFLAGYNSYWNLLMAAATLTIVPLVLVFFWGQKYFVQGLTVGGLKG